MRRKNNKVKASSPKAHSVISSFLIITIVLMFIGVNIWAHLTLPSTDQNLNQENEENPADSVYAD